MDHLTYYYIGIATIFLTHLYMFANPEMNSISGRIHALINIIAASFIAYYFMHKEGFITY